ncbi:hypothetical protein [Herbidospora yilanensis]|uniref:hypothetical protein n=1 Tax=Herbidospora yilanensis TaxID=354426 RepID=UPI0007817581|nr:hypothetical protein [Herbidospora yilanensis]
MTQRPLLLALAGAALGAAAARAAYAAFTKKQPFGDEKTWARVNHRGEPVTLLEGPAFAAGAGAALALTPGLPVRVKAAGVLTSVACGALGAYDDVFGTSASKGFKGHLSALRRGQVTSGAVKILGIGATGLAAAALTRRNVADIAIDGLLIAGSANLANLFDLRPGRAIKVGLLAGAPLAGSPLAAVPLGAAAALLPGDLAERAMLGDTGANALGALLGLAAAQKLGRPGRLAVLGTVAALTAASEKVSFTKVIAGNPVLNRLDMLGRRPVPPPAEVTRPTP